MKKECVVCGGEFETSQSKAKYCSRKCASANRKPIACYTYICLNCGIQYHPKEKTRDKYCSRICAFAALAEKKKERAAIIEEKPPRVNVCACCGKEHSNNRARYCSDGCKKEVARKKSKERGERQYYPKTFKCKECGKDVSPGYGSKRRKFCSDVCLDRHGKKQRPDCLTHRKKARHYGVEYQYINPRKVFIRDGWVCQICGRNTPERLRGKNNPRSPELDHVVPISKGGGHTYANVQCACRRCNGSKGNNNSAGQLRLCI